MALRAGYYGIKKKMLDTIKNVKPVKANPTGTATGGNLEKIEINNIIYSIPSGTPYELPVASDETLGGIKVGDGLSISENGVLSVSGGSGGGGLDYSTTEQNTGIKWVDGSDIYFKTYTPTTPINIGQEGAWIDTGIDATGIGQIVNVQSWGVDGNTQFTKVFRQLDAFSVDTTDNRINVLARLGGVITGFAIWYTKTSSQSS